MCHFCDYVTAPTLFTSDLVNNKCERSNHNINILADFGAHIIQSNTYIITFKSFKFSLRNHTGSFVLLLENIILLVAVFCRT